MPERKSTRVLWRPSTVLLADTQPTRQQICVAMNCRWKVRICFECRITFLTRNMLSPPCVSNAGRDALAAKSPVHFFQEIQLWRHEKSWAFRLSLDRADNARLNGPKIKNPPRKFLQTFKQETEQLYSDLSECSPVVYSSFLALGQPQRLLQL